MVPQMDAIDIFASSSGSFRVYVADASIEELRKFRGESSASSGRGEGRIGEIARQLVHGRRRRRRGRRAPSHTDVAAAYFLRFVTLFAPCPEFSLLLLDWARADGFGRLSAALWPLLAAFVRLDLPAARKMAFAMTLVGGADGDGDALDAMAFRNGIAVDGVREVLGMGIGARRVRVLYGALHMPDLERRIHAAFNVVRTRETEWRTVWSADLKGPVTDLVRARLSLLGVPAYLLLGALDYGTTVVSVADASGPAAAAAAIVLYVARRSLFYYALSRWLFEWDVQLFESARRM